MTGVRSHLVALVAGLALVPAAATGVAAETVLKFGFVSPATSYDARTGYIPWMDRIEQQTHGRIKFQRFMGGALSRALDKQYELLLNGVQDVTLVLPSYTQKLFPDYGFFGLPYLVDTAEEAAVAGWRLHERGLLHGTEKMYVAAIYANGNSSVHLNRPIKSPDDIKGLKIRVSGPEEAEMIQALGAAPVGMSITQVAESLNRGVIDGLLSSWSALRSFRIMPLLKSHYDEPLGVRAFILGINKAVFDKLPREDRDVIVANSGEKQSRHHGKMADEEVASAKAEARQDPNRIFVSPSNEEMAKRREAFRRKYYQEWTAEHPNGEKILTTFEAILADVRAGK